ncbi:hypothetical protein GCM10009736_11860 [Actinomadura bangladeshensis]
MPAPEPQFVKAAHGPLRIAVRAPVPAFVLVPDARHPRNLSIADDSVPARGKPPVRPGTVPYRMRRSE